MSKKSHPTDGVDSNGVKGGSFTEIDEQFSHGLLIHIFAAWHNLRRIVKFALA